jgi:uncharacterized protein YjeT (DUF2065 family)
MLPGKILLLAIALMLIAEGLFPLLAPGVWRAVFTHLVSLKNGQIRYIGLASGAAGVALLLLLSFWG